MNEPINLKAGIMMHISTEEKALAKALQRHLGFSEISAEFMATILYVEIEQAIEQELENYSEEIVE